MPDEEDYVGMHRIIERSDWALHRCHTYWETVAFLSQHRVSVVIADCDLSGGDWRKILDGTSHLNFAPKLIVVHRFAEFHAAIQLLGRGVYGILAKPFREGEVLQTLDFAWMQCHRDWPFGRRTAGADRPPQPAPGSLAAAGVRLFGTAGCGASAGWAAAGRL